MTAKKPTAKKNAVKKTAETSPGENTAPDKATELDSVATSSNDEVSSPSVESAVASPDTSHPKLGLNDPDPLPSNMTGPPSNGPQVHLLDETGSKAVLS